MTVWSHIARALDARTERVREAPVWALLVSSVLVVILYSPSLGGPFLNLDDAWLIRENPAFHPPTLHTLRWIWTDFSPVTRLSLGAEYLPIRDTSVWLDACLTDLSPLFMRLVNLACYLAALAFVRGALCRALGKGLAVEFAILLFALHPVHVESVAWLAGRKDVLALLFVACGLFVHAGHSRLRPFLVPALFGCAYFSKAQSVVAIGLLAAHDLLAKRRFDLRVYAPVFVTAVLAATLHARVGHSVHMLAVLAGGSHLSAAFTLGEIISRYLFNLLLPLRLSIVYDAPAALRLSAASALGYGVLLLWGGAGLVEWRRAQRPMLLAAWLWFVVPLLPVSQLIFPLQNRMADRYLLFSVLALGLILGSAVERLKGNWRTLALCGAGAELLLFGLVTFERSHLFAESVLLFEDATRKTERSTLAPFQWATALEARRNPAAAEQAYLEVLRRSTRPTEPGRRATNNLAQLFAREGRLDEASALLVRGRVFWPNDPKILSNLATVTARRGHEAEAAALSTELHQRFPDFRPGQRSAADLYSAH